MIVAGVGLLGLRPWSRTAALWVAGLKLGRLAVIASVAFLLLIPYQVQKAQRTTTRHLARSGGTMPPGYPASMGIETARMTAVSLSLTLAGFTAFGSIYPAPHALAVKQAGRSGRARRGRGPTGTESHRRQHGLRQ